MGDGMLRLDFDGGWSVKELSEFLGAFRHAYGSVLHFERSFDSRDQFRPPRFWRGEFPLAILEHRSPEPEAHSDSWNTTLDLVGELQLKSIHIASPGWIEVIGKWNPLALLVDFIKWWPNRDLDRQKSVNEVEHGSLENLLLKNKVVKERFEMLLEMGYSKRKARELLASHAAKPLLELEPFIEGKSIKAEVKALPEGKKRSKKKEKEVEQMDFTPADPEPNEQEEPIGQLVEERDVEPEDPDEDPNSGR